MVKISVQALKAGVVVVAPVGVLDLEASPALREALQAVLGDGSARLVVDLSGVETIDSVALGVLVSGLKSARKNGGDLRLARPSDRVKTLLKLAGLDRFFESADTAF